MTKEEALTIVNSIDRNILTDKECYVVNNIFELVAPSFPPNLDEAAEEYAFTNWEDNDYYEGAGEGVPFDPIGYTEKVFKAGAEWMSNQLKQGMNEENILVPKFVLESIENTLRIQYNINTGKNETCQGRNIKGSLNQVRKLLADEEVTGMERLEPLYK